MSDAEGSEGTRGAGLDLLALGLILSAFGFAMGLLQSIDEEPPKWDESIHLRDSLIFYNILQDPTQLKPEIVRAVLDRSDQYPLLRPSGYYPPLTPGITALAYFVLGPSIRSSILSNLVFVAMLTLTTYGLGRALLDRKGAWLASLSVLLFPIVLEHSVIYMLDLPLAGVFSLSLLALVKTDDFRHRKTSVLFGLCFGLGMLSKWTYLFFIAGPLLHLALKGRMWRSWPNVLLASLVAAIIFCPYYLPLLPLLLDKIQFFASDPLANTAGDRFSLASISFYPVTLYNDILSPVGVALVVAGVGALFLSKVRAKTFLLVSLLVPLMIFTFAIELRSGRFFFPALPLLALIIGALATKRTSARTGSLILGLCVLGLLAVTAMTGSGLRDQFLDNSKDDWKLHEMIAVIKEDLHTNTGQEIPRLGVIPNHPYVNGQTLSFYAALESLPITVVKLEDYRKDAAQRFERQFELYDYILIKSALSASRKISRGPIEQMQRSFNRRRDDFRLLHSFSMPDGSTVDIHGRK